VSGNAIYLLTIWAIPVIIAITFNGSLAIFAVYLIVTQSTARYTSLASDRFARFWQD
jgi:hypothetical protein